MSEATPSSRPPLDASLFAKLAQEFQRAYVYRKVVAVPAATRALLIAAHADDVEIGCGGTVLKLIDAQIPMQQVVLTDGRLAAPKPEEEEAMAKTRADEARSVAAHLMLPPPELFGASERNFSSPALAGDLIARLAKLLAAFQPDAIFVPWFFDQHPDHRYANHLLARALPPSGLDVARTTVYSYEAWALVPPMLVVDVSDVYAEKRRLISLYRSQLALTPYLEMVDQINKPRAGLAGPRATAAEFFRPFRGDEYVARALELDLASEQSRSLNVMLTPLP